MRRRRDVTQAQIQTYCLEARDGRRLTYEVQTARPHTLSKNGKTQPRNSTAGEYLTNSGD